MTAEDRKPEEKCPFWSATSLKCTICRNGLFIPLDNHVETFCKTSRFHACMQYSLYSEKQIFLQEKVRKSEVNRRKSIRVQSSHIITLVKIFESDGTTPPPPYEIQTIDVSKSGMRVSLDQPLLYDALVQFSFDDSFLLKIHEITGQVEWCNKQIDEPGYQAGLSFRNKRIIDAHNRVLDQQHNQ